MKRLKIKNPYANFISPNFATDEEMQAWIEKELHNGNYGKPAWTEKKLVGEYKFENGKDVSEYVTIEHEAEYSYEIADISAEIAELEAQKQAKKAKEEKVKLAKDALKAFDPKKPQTLATLTKQIEVMMVLLEAHE